MISFIKLFSGMLAVVAIVLFILRAIGVLSWQIFWIVMLLLGGFAYLVLPLFTSESHE